MPPRNADIAAYEADAVTGEVPPAVLEQVAEQKRPPTQIVWRNVVYFAILHLMALYGLFLLPWAHPLTWAWTCLVYLMNALGITAGVHRLWTHRSYRAKLPLRIMLAVFNCIAFQNDIIEWSRDHRAHHKYSETDGDPHNAKRGFFFAHCGWLMARKHPEVKEKGKFVDISDLLADPVCVIQRKLYLPGVLLLCFVMPTVVPWYYWGENIWTAYFVCATFRYVLALNVTWFVNSAAHMWGNRPYDRCINPAENFLVAFGAIGEGFHNYHHVFPSDYSTSEYGWRVNITTMFIDCMAKLGLATDRKKVKSDLVDRRKERCGDGTVGFGY